MRKALRFVIVIAVAAVVGGIAYYVFQQNQLSQGPLAASGTIEATEIEVSAQTAARITSVAVEEGGSVKKGHVVARLDRSLLIDQVKQAKAGISAARAAVRETKDVGSHADVAAAKAQLRQARVTYAMALTQLSFATATSPISGVVLSVPVNAGENATPGSTLAIIGDLSKVHVHVFIPEAQLGLIKLGEPATIAIDSGQSFKGKVTNVASQAEFTPANVETKDQRVKLVFQVTVTLANPGRVLKPGMPAGVTFD